MIDYYDLYRDLKLMSFSDSPRPIFIPKKHTKQTYRSQQRAAKKNKSK